MGGQARTAEDARRGADGHHYIYANRREIARIPNPSPLITMKLAEALVLRADHQKRLEQLKARLLRNAKVQEGEKPAEDPTALLTQMEETAAELERLIQRINRTNAATTLEGKRSETLSDALARRDVVVVRRAVYAELAQAATVTQDRYSKSEVKFKSTVNVSEMQKRADDLAKEYRELDTRLQSANWATDLLE